MNPTQIKSLQENLIHCSWEFQYTDRASGETRALPATIQKKDQQLQVQVAKYFERGLTFQLHMEKDGSLQGNYTVHHFEKNGEISFVPRSETMFEGRPSHVQWVTEWVLKTIS